MTYSRILLVGITAFMAASLGCGNGNSGPTWVSAFLIPMAGTNRQDTWCMVDGDKKPAGDIWVKVEADKDKESREFNFHPSDDLDPGPAMRFPIQVPKRSGYTIRTSYDEKGCGACAPCEEYCTGTKKGAVTRASRQIYYEKGQNDNGGQDIEIGYFGGFIPFAPNYCECLSETQCTADGGRITDGDPDIGNFGGAGSGGGSSGGTPSSGGDTSTGGASGGTTSSGGDASTGGVSTGGSATGGDTSTGGGTTVDPVCGENMAIVGQYATWCGKVNVHTTNDGWVSDSDCSSGCNINTVSYCQKFWPGATTQVHLEAPTSDKKTFEDAGCASGYSHQGFDQYACCALLD